MLPSRRLPFGPGGASGFLVYESSSVIVPLSIAVLFRVARAIGQSVSGT